MIFLVAWQKANINGSGVIDGVLLYAGAKQLFSKKLSAKNGALFTKAQDFAESMAELGTELLPPDHHGLQPGVLLITVSPMEGCKSTVFASSSLATDATFLALAKAAVNSMVSIQTANRSAAAGCARAGEPIQPPQQQTKRPKSEYHAKQACFAGHWRGDLKGKLPGPKSKIISSEFFSRDMRTRCSCLSFSFCPSHLFVSARGACSGTKDRELHLHCKHC